MGQARRISDKSIQLERVSEKSIQLERISDKSIQLERISESGIQSERISDKSIQLERISDKSIQSERVSERSIPSERISAVMGIQDASSLGHIRVVLERSSTFNLRAPNLGHSDAARITQPVAKPVAPRGTDAVKVRLMRSISEDSHDISYVIPPKNVFAPRDMANLPDNAVVNQPMDMKRLKI